MGEKSTHFGYQTVAEDDKAEMVRGVFDSVAARYDLMNDLMSLGIHRVWKRYAIEMAALRPGHKVLDLASGTGDLVALAARLLGKEGLIAMTDINANMLARGRDRLVDQGCVGNLVHAQVDAENLPFPDNTFDCVSMAFGLRNVTRKEAALSAMRHVLRPGGRVLILEFSKPNNQPLEALYDFYSFSVLPTLGRVVAGDADSYRYLAESIRKHPDQDRLKGMLEEAGFERCDVHNLSGGIVALHRGFKL
jgi:demethylmenaquinone methyltransferase/2-methoxy-6-polyprenyl-1,4-benzoquinol methylase